MVAKDGLKDCSLPLLPLESSAFVFFLCVYLPSLFVSLCYEELIHSRHTCNKEKKHSAKVA